MKVELNINGSLKLTLIPETNLEREFVKNLMESPDEIKVETVAHANTNNEITVSRPIKK